MNLTCLCLQENLSEIRQENVKLTLNQQLIRFSAHLAAWVVSTGVAIACCVAVYYLADNNSQVTRKLGAPGSRQMEGVLEGRVEVSPLLKPGSVASSIGVT